MSQRINRLRHQAGLVFSAGVTAAVVTFLLNCYQQRADEQQRAATVAIQVASSLEMFSSVCWDIANHYDAGYPRRRLAIRIPAFPAATTTLDLHALSLDDQDAILALPLKIDAANQYMLSAEQFATPHDVAEATRDEAVLLGASAWELATRLRTRWGFPQLRLVQPFGADLVLSARQLTNNWHRAQGGVDPR